MFVFLFRRFSSYTKFDAWKLFLDLCLIDNYCGFGYIGGWTKLEKNLSMFVIQIQLLNLFFGDLVILCANILPHQR